MGPVSVTIVACGWSGGEKKPNVSGCAKSKSLRKQISGTPARLAASCGADEELASRMVDECLDLYFRSNVRAWELQSTGEYEAVATSEGEEDRLEAQLHLLESLADIS